jgi:hypothetical protein
MSRYFIPSPYYQHACQNDTRRSFFPVVNVELKFFKVHLAETIGSDVVPFWLSLKNIAPHADVFLKIHWKHSPHLDQHYPQADGSPACNAWNEDLFSSLVQDD